MQFNRASMCLPPVWQAVHHQHHILPKLLFTQSTCCVIFQMLSLRLFNQPTLKDHMKRHMELWDGGAKFFTANIWPYFKAD